MKINEMVTKTIVLLILASVSTCYPVNDNYLTNLHEINNLNIFENVKAPIQDTNITIEEVEDIIKYDQSLPRLTRGEIIDIIANITERNEKQRKQKAVMIVMPYTANNNSGAVMEELFTKAPVTKLIGTESFVVKPFEGSQKGSLKHSTFKNDGVQNPNVGEIKSTTVLLESTSSRTPLKRRRRPTPQHFTNHKYSEEKIVQNNNVRVDVPIFKTTQVFVPSRTDNEVAPRPASLPQPSYRPIAPMSSSPFSLTQRPYLPETSSTKFVKLPDLPDDIKAALNNLNLQGYAVENMREPEEGLEDDIETFVEPTGELFNVQAITTSTEIPDIAHVADNLTPEMKDLLTSFGLLGNSNNNNKAIGFKELTTNEATAPNITRESYLKFKPLPASAPTSDDMEEFLGRFGLGRESKPKRKQKAIQGVPDLPENMTNMLVEMELLGKKVSDKNNIFKPTVKSYNSEEELDKLNQLLDIIKQLEKLNATNEQEINKTVNLDQLNELVTSINQHELVPFDQQIYELNPLNYDESQNKNEVKRQENSTTVSPNTSTLESVMPDIKDLEASFGGNTGIIEPMVTVPPPTEGPKTGFYYLLDWNSFLDIDDQKGRRVNLRFQPKVGDPKRFLSVTVP